MAEDLITHERLDEMVDADPIRLRDEAYKLLAEVERLRAELVENEGVIKALRRHRDTAEAGIAHLEQRVIRLQRRAGTAEERLALARDAILRDGYFRPAEVGPDIAPRIIERLSALSSERDEWRERAYAAEAKAIVVRALHQPGGDQGKAWCRHCSDNDYPRYETPWPCPTIAALDDTKPDTEPETS